ncbi:hypothetical protein [Hasllibacter sp. MH4015]|uniref:hypothetical protein n=1 Tax=Hasllibacter sp. MH4015 TaxID=2854029 RepID=UPI001CD7EB67|nr:hypothetical protein [Hasllibacter sp. MH4015]
MEQRKTFAAVTLVTVLSVLPGAVRAQDPDPVTADPDQIAARITLPEGLAMQDGGVVMTMGAINEVTGAQTLEVYALVPSRTEPHMVLSGPDRARLAAQQALIVGWMDAGHEVDGSFAVTLAPCRTGVEVPGRARASMALRADAESGFQVVVEDMRVRRLIGQPIRDLPPCEG